jgi:hypothetical protein
MYVVLSMAFTPRGLFMRVIAHGYARSVPSHIYKIKQWISLKSGAAAGTQRGAF